MSAANIPLTAWEQLAVVCVFVVLLLGSMAALRWLLNDQRKAQLASQQALLKQQQEFIEKQNQDWQKFLEAQRKSDKDQRDQDRTAITQIIAILDHLVDKFSDHDTWERTEIDNMRQAINESKTQPRKGE